MKKIKSFLKDNIIIAYIGVLLMIIGTILLIPLLTLIVYHNEVRHTLSFVIPSAVAIITGFILSKASSFKENEKLSVGEDAVIVVSIWILATLFSALPFIISGELNFTQAYFESVSGWTTTGLSVIDVEECPKIFLIHRSTMNFFGGVGIVLVMVSALSSTFGMKLYNSEGHLDKLLPNLLKSSRMIMSIYSGYVISGIILYCILGMPLFDAINHSIAALSTGGFGVRTDSIGAYNSFPIELVTIILMILGTTNFAAHLLLVSGKFKKFLKISEIRFMLILIGISIPLVAFTSLNGLYGSLGKGLRVASFEIISALSTTGFSTVGYSNWSSFAIFIMIILMIIGGGAGSTAGGIKLYRVYLMIKRLIWNLRKKFISDNLVNEDRMFKPEGKVYIEKSDIMDASNYAFIYMIIFIIGVSIMLIHGYPLQDSLFEFASSLGTVGLSIGITSATAPPIILWTEIIGMMFGRLEIWVIFIATIKILKNFKNKRSITSKIN
ncbi:TrkH family potassium uptake protein [Clostridium sp. CCUG 7971]|uniref:TrkH family potassium uptake protein n=1 Tax=Clostridium sp. CCUG 7971 TaxID=2811414 RepID=UPI001ABB7B13|nr:TrkH family potassium uptake protein [Clostridium sp. CCUG 7971]MBO3444416.1 TrkH family potassium uptake protein [Clostridium sp. CCUG 7971]